MARKARNVYSAVQLRPRMSWHPANLFALQERTFGQRSKESVFTASNRTVFWQRFRSKALLRGYHGDWIQEKRFKRHWLPANLPRVQRSPLGHGAKGHAEQTPVTSMMWAELERRLDVAVFRACFADSVYEARRMVVHGSVKLNGQKCVHAWTRLNPGDLVSVDARAIPMLGNGKIWSSRYGGVPAVVGGSQPQPTSREAGVDDSSEPAPATQSSAEGDATGDAVDAISSVEAGNQGQATEPNDQESAPETVQSGEVDPGTSNTVVPKAASRPQGPSPFSLPPYASPFLFIPPNLEVSFRLTSFVFLRAPTCGPGYSEVPTPWDADGEVARLAWEWYTKQGQGKRIRSERKAGELRRRERTDPFAEAHLRKTSAGARVGVAGSRPKARRIATSPRGPQADPHRLVALRP